MTRIGSALAALALALLPIAAQAELEFYMTAEPELVGLDDVFRLTIVISDPPSGASLEYPDSDGFEVLSKSSSSQRSFQFGSGGPADIKTVQKYVLVMRATRTGKVTIPPARLAGPSIDEKTEPVTITVRPGSVTPRDDDAADAQPHRSQGGGNARPPRDPLRDFFEDSPFAVDIPRSNSDLFLKMTIDKPEIYVGEQATLSLYVFSRIELSSVDAVTMPKLGGFWSEDGESPTQLMAEQRVLNGVLYRAYLLRRRALFPVRSGEVTIEPSEADITTGSFFMAGGRVHRKSNPVKLKVKPLPAGAPAGFASANVGQWELEVEANVHEVQLGNPVTVRVVMEGVGNVRQISMPKLEAPQSFKVYDPTPSEKLGTARGKISGRRVNEYLVLPQQTGTFTLPALSFPYFDPDSGKYEVARSAPVTISVTPGAATGAPISGSPADSTIATGDVARNVLTASPLRPLRYVASFEAPSTPVWTRSFFLPAVLAPLGIWFALGALGLVRARLNVDDPIARKKRQARAAQKRLAHAETLKGHPRAAEFYGEVEKALLGFIEAKMGAPVTGLTREALRDRMRDCGVADANQKRVLEVLDLCDAGRFAPGVADADRDRALEAAAEAMEAWA